MNKVNTIYEEFTNQWGGNVPEHIRSNSDYGRVVDDLVDSVLRVAEDTNSNDLDVYTIAWETIGSSQFVIYTRYHTDIYDYSEFTEDSLDNFTLGDYTHISDALQGFAFQSLYESVCQNKYIQQLAELEES